MNFPTRLFPFLCSLLIAAGSFSCVKPVVDACYTPDGNCTATVAAEIGSARTEVLVQAYALTSKTLADALAQAKESGVTVSVILDRSYPYMQNSALYLSSLRGIPTFIDTRHAVAGNNVIIIDRSVVITGSMAFTAEAEEKNAENMVIIRSSSVAESFRTNWTAHKDHAEEYTAEQQKPEQPKTAAKPEKKKNAKGKKKKTS